MGSAAYYFTSTAKPQPKAEKLRSENPLIAKMNKAFSLKIQAKLSSTKSVNLADTANKAAL